MEIVLENLGKLHYRVNEESGNQNYIFIHGNSLNHESFSGQFKLNLNGSSYFLDLPGHGKSFKSGHKNAYSLNWFSEIIQEFINVLSLKNVVLIGHSLGGHISMQTAHKNNQIKGVIVFGAPPLSFPPDLGAAFNPVPEGALAYKSNLTEDEIVSLSKFYSGDQSIQLRYQSMIRDTHPEFREKLMAGAMAGQMQDEIESIKTSGVKFAILNGTQDPAINQGYLTTVGAPITTDNKIYPIEGGHSIQLECIEEFNSGLLEILGNFEK